MNTGIITEVGPGKVRVSKVGIALFNARWPDSTLRSERAYWMEFHPDGDLIDTDIPEQDDGPAALVLSNDCKAWLFDGVSPEWLP